MKSSLTTSCLPALGFRLLIALGVVFAAGCTAVNNSGVALHRKPDLSGVIPGTSLRRVAGLGEPAKKEPLVSADPKGPEVWIYEWDLPDDGVNNKMFTSVVVKDGIILGYAEETPDKWTKNPVLYNEAVQASELENGASLAAMAAAVQKHGRSKLRAGASQLQQWEYPFERGGFAGGESAALPTITPGERDWRALPHGRHVGPVRALLDRRNFVAHGAAEEIVPPVGSADAPAAQAGVAAAGTPPAAQGVAAVAGNDSAPPAASAKKSLRELEAEELRIRKDASLTKEERMRKLREIWKLQLEVSGKKEA